MRSLVALFMLSALSEAMFAPPFFNEMMFNQIMIEQRRRDALAYWSQHPPQKGDLVSIHFHSRAGFGNDMYMARHNEMFGLSKMLLNFAVENESESMSK